MLFWNRDSRYLVITKCDLVINFGEKARTAPKILEQSKLTYLPSVPHICDSESDQLVQIRALCRIAPSHGFSRLGLLFSDLTAVAESIFVIFCTLLFQGELNVRNTFEYIAQNMLKTIFLS